MITLEPLCTMALGLERPIDVGPAPTGRRIVAAVAGGEVSGRLSGHLAGTSSADWLTVTDDGVGLLDVRLAIETDDGAFVLVRYSGRLRFVPEQPSVAMVAPLFETGDERYGWLNDIQAVGKGVLAPDLSRLDYELYELR